VIERVMAGQEASMATIIIFGVSWFVIALAMFGSLVLSAMLLKGANTYPRLSKECSNAILKLQDT
jgi:hypothetical protein